MSGLANTVNLGGALAQGVGLGLNIRQLEAQQAEQAANREERALQREIQQQQFATQQGNVDRGFKMRQDEQTRQNDQQAFMGQFAGEQAGLMFPGEDGAEEPVQMPEYLQTGGELGQMSQFDPLGGQEDFVGAGGDPMGGEEDLSAPIPFSNDYPTPTFQQPELQMAAPEPEAQLEQSPLPAGGALGMGQQGGMAAPMASGMPQQGGQGPQQAGGPFGGLDWSKSPEQFSRFVAEQGMREMIVQKERQRQTQGALAMRDKVLARFKGMPDELGQLAANPADRSLWGPAIAQLGPNSARQLEQVLNAADMAESGFAIEAMQGVANQMFGNGYQRGGLTQNQQYQINTNQQMADDWWASLTPDQQANPAAKSAYSSMVGGHSNPGQVLPRSLAGITTPSEQTSKQRAKLATSADLTRAERDETNARKALERAQKQHDDDFAVRFGYAEGSEDATRVAKLRDAITAADTVYQTAAARRDAMLSGMVEGPQGQQGGDPAPAPRKGQPAPADDVPDEVIDQIISQHPDWSPEQIEAEIRRGGGRSQAPSGKPVIKNTSVDFMKKNFGSGSQTQQRGKPPQ